MKRTALVVLLAAGLLGGQAPTWQRAEPPKTVQPARQAAKPAVRPRPVRGAAAEPGSPSYKDLKFPPLREVKIPDVATFTLANGMKLYLVENHELPLVSGFALVRTGNLFDPPDKVGLAETTGMVMRTGGTAAKTGDELDEQLENIAASVESSIGETSGRVSFSALAENTDEVLGVFHDLLTAPAFREEKIDLAKTQLRSAISRRNDNAPAIAAREFSEILYGRDNPYGWRLEYEHVDRIRRQDLVEFHRRYFFPANVMLAVHGDFQAPEMKARIEKLFSGWTVQQPAVPPFPALREKASPGVFLAVKDDVTQTFFHLGHLGGVLRDKNYPALEVMADILGGGFRSRLFRKVRTQLGYAYSIGASWGANYNHRGLFEISGSTKSVSTTETLEVIREEIEKMRTQEVSDEELESARQKVLNSFVFNFDTPGKTLGRVIAYEYHGYPKDFIFQYQRAVAAVTKADILRVAREYLRPQDYAVVAVGKPKDFGKAMSELGMPVQPIDLTIPEPKRELAKADPASLQRGRRLLARLQQAVGGAEVLASVKDYSARVDARFYMGGSPMPAKMQQRWVSPSSLRQDQELPIGKVIVYFDGSAGWLSGPQGTGPLQEPYLGQMRSGVFRLPFTLWLSDRDDNRTISATGDGPIEISDAQGNLVRLQLDEQTGLPVKEMYRMQGMGGAPAEVEESYSDWRETKGILLPHKIEIRRGAEKAAEMTVEEILINSGITAEELSKRP